MCLVWNSWDILQASLLLRVVLLPLALLPRLAYLVLPFSLLFSSPYPSVFRLTLLHNAGLAHSAYAIKHESGLENAVSANGTRLLDCHVPQNHLIRLLHKGLLYLEAEAKWRGVSSVFHQILNLARS